MSASPATSRTVRQLAWFAAIGVVSTVAYVVLYAALRTGLPAEASNALALILTAIGNTAANRRLTFAVHGPEHALRDQAAGLLAFAVALAITTLAIAVLHAAAPFVSRSIEILVLVVANGLATLVRFLILRVSIDRRATAPQATGSLP